MTVPGSRATSVYFGAAGAQLFGWLHVPESSPRGPAVVICPPLGHDMIMSHRGLRHLAEALADAGMPTLRFDYHGTGDSSGSDYEPDRVRAWLDSIGQAIDEARRLTGAASVALIGVRLGSLLAMHAAARRPDVSAMVAWAPVACGRARVREFRAFEQLMSGDDPVPDEVPEGAVAAAGFILTKETVQDLHALDVTGLAGPPAPQILVVPRDDLPDDGKVVAALEATGATVTNRPLPGYHVMMQDPHATAVPRAAIAGMVGWLSALPASALQMVRPPEHPVLRSVASSAALMQMELPGVAGPITERPFHAHGGRLFGIMTEPGGAVSPDRPALILANSGAVHRVGPSRLYVEFARVLAERGFRVLRLDIGGLGDSAPFPGADENQAYSPRAVADVEEAATALRTDGGSERVILGGLCSGAHTAFHAALRLEGIAGIVMLNPVVFYWKPSDALNVAAYMTYHRMRWYRSNVTRTGAWVRLLRGEVDTLKLARTLMARGRDRATARVRSLAREMARRLQREPPGDDAPRDLARLCDRGVDVLLLFSEGDPGLDFLRLNHAAAVRRLSRRREFTRCVIAHPGHTFTRIAAQRDVLSIMTRHVLDRFG